MKILITGYKGFVGQATVKLMDEMNIPWVGFDLMDGQDIRDANQFEQVLLASGCDRILHLAAIARFSDADKNPKGAFTTNVLGTGVVAQVAQKHHIPVVYSSTGSVYMPINLEPPITEEFPAIGNSVYGCSKRMGEIYLQESISPWIILRYAHLYGKEKRMHGLIGGYLDRINRGLAPKLYGGKQSNDFTYVKDVARANILALDAPWDKWNQIYNIGTGEELTAEAAGKIVMDLTDYKGEVEKVEQRTVDPERFAFDCTKADQMLGFKAQYDFKAGMEDMFDEINNPKSESVLSEQQS
jgi:nucleoside-diphosphate-sugar epimerase